MGDLFKLDTPLSGTRPARIRVGTLELQVWSPVRGIRERLEAMQPGDRIKGFADLDDYRGNLQVVIRDPSWLP